MSLVSAVLTAGVDSPTSSLDTDGSHMDDLYKNLEVRSSKAADVTDENTHGTVKELIGSNAGIGGTVIKSVVVKTVIPLGMDTTTVNGGDACTS